MYCLNSVSLFVKVIIYLWWGLESKMWVQKGTCSVGQVMGPPPRSLQCLPCHTGWTLEAMDDLDRHPEHHKIRNGRGWVTCVRTLPSSSHFELLFQLHRIYSVVFIFTVYFSLSFFYINLSINNTSVNGGEGKPGLILMEELRLIPLVWGGWTT